MPEEREGGMGGGVGGGWDRPFLLPASCSVGSSSFETSSLRTGSIFTTAYLPRICWDVTHPVSFR